MNVLEFMEYEEVKETCDSDTQVTYKVWDGRDQIFIQNWPMISKLWNLSFLAVKSATLDELK